MEQKYYSVQEEKHRKATKGLTRDVCCITYIMIDKSTVHL